MIVLVVPSASVDSAVTPTVSSLAAVSPIVLSPPLESAGAPTSNSSTSVTATENVVEAVSYTHLTLPTTD